jgi:hypothetical protein
MLYHLVFAAFLALGAAAVDLSAEATEYASLSLLSISKILQSSVLSTFQNNPSQGCYTFMFLLHVG